MGGGTVFQFHHSFCCGAAVRTGHRHTTHAHPLC